MLFRPSSGQIVEGIVTDVGWYRTTIRSFEREIYNIPNSGGFGLLGCISSNERSLGDCCSAMLAAPQLGYSCGRQHHCSQGHLLPVVPNFALCCPSFCELSLRPTPQCSRGRWCSTSRARTERCAHCITAGLQLHERSH